jgi:diguanylate cyclase (GGDEF)-like protein
MSDSPQARLAQLDVTGDLAADMAAGVDRRARQLRLMLRSVALTTAAVAVLEVAAGFIYRDSRAVGLGLAAFGYGGLVAYLTACIESIGRERVVARVAALTLALLATATIVEPSLAPAMAIAALLPSVLVLPFLGTRQVSRTLIAAGVIGIGSVVAGGLLPVDTGLPPDVTKLIAFVTLVVSYVFLLVFLWEVSRRLKTTADDLRSIIAMSNDLARTMDPQLVGDRIARHIGQAVGASDCALSYWDRPADRLVTLGYFPPERRNVLAPSYALADYPATRVVLEQAQPAIIDTADPDADRHEVAYLETIHQQSMAIIPLVAAGTTIGTLELTSDRRGAFGPRDVEMATMLASEAAMALENARLYDAIRHQALHDGLTGLANRALFRERVGRAIDRSRGRDGHPFAILFIDLDDFKRLNDTLGHARGDDVLVAVARRVEDSLRPTDMAARLGGDEFAVLLDDVADEELALSIAIRLADELRQPIRLADTSPTIAASIGVALSGSDARETADDLLRNADVAMYAAKASSRGRAEVFRSTYRAEAAARSELAARLRGVEQRGELRLDYQPIIELVGGAVVGLETLVRWQPPDRPLLMPGQFIDLAEETGDIVPMGQWILRESCRQLREWQLRLGLPHLQVSVNLSARQFREHDLVKSVRTILAETELPPASLILEITESGLMQRTDGTINTLAELRGLGAHLAIDDFGTGYSSLSYLERFPVDSLKIDRAFIAGMSASADRPAIARAIVELGRTLGLKIVAEGIEERDQADWLISLGCQYGQGYLFSRPMGVDATEAFLAADATRRVQQRGSDEDDGDSMGPTAPRRKAATRGTTPLRLVSGE